MGSFCMLTLYLSPPFQTDFTIRTNCHHLSRSLFLKHGKYIAVSDEPRGKVIAAFRENDGYRIEFDGIITCSPNALSEIDHIVCENTHYDERFFALHGAAVGNEGKAYLFLAATTGRQDDACKLPFRRRFSIHHRRLHFAPSDELCRLPLSNADSSAGRRASGFEEVAGRSPGPSAV